MLQHCNRSVLTRDDINTAIRAAHLPPLTGYTASSGGSFKVARPASIATANYATNSSASSAEDVFYAEDAVVSVEMMLAHTATALSIVPKQPVLAVHWLSVAGVQPLIPQNPTPAERAAVMSGTALIQPPPHHTGGGHGVGNLATGGSANAGYNGTVFAAANAAAMALAVSAANSTANPLALVHQSAHNSYNNNSATATASAVDSNTGGSGGGHSSVIAAGSNKRRTLGSTHGAHGTTGAHSHSAGTHAGAAASGTASGSTSTAVVAAGGLTSAASGLTSAQILRHSSDHTLSQEQQQLLIRLTSALSSRDPSRARAALHLVRTDAHATAQLTPYLVHFVAQSVASHNTRAAALLPPLALARALVAAPYTGLDTYLDSLLPAALAALLAPALALAPSEDHWTVRDRAAAVVAAAVARWGGQYPTLLPRTCETLGAALTEPAAGGAGLTITLPAATSPRVPAGTRGGQMTVSGMGSGAAGEVVRLPPLTTLYGAVRGLTLIGARAVKSIVVPAAPRLIKALQALLLLSSSSSSTIAINSNASVIQGAAVNANSASVSASASASASVNNDSLVVGTVVSSDKSAVFTPGMLTVTSYLQKQKQQKTAAAAAVTQSKNPSVSEVFALSNDDGHDDSNSSADMNGALVVSAPTAARLSTPLDFQASMASRNPWIRLEATRALQALLCAVTSYCALTVTGTVGAEERRDRDALTVTVAKAQWYEAQEQAIKNHNNNNDRTRDSQSVMGSSAAAESAESAASGHVAVRTMKRKVAATEKRSGQNSELYKQRLADAAKAAAAASAVGDNAVSAAGHCKWLLPHVSVHASGSQSLVSARLSTPGFGVSSRPLLLSVSQEEVLHTESLANITWLQNTLGAEAVTQALVRPTDPLAACVL